MTALLRRWLIAGLLIWIPLGATLLVIRFMIGVLDTSLLLIPQPIRPDFTGLGVLLSVALVLGTGFVAANFIGSRALEWAEGALLRVPLIRSVYGGMKKLAETVLSGSSASFRQSVLLEYPRQGLWTVAFVTGEPAREMREKIGQDLLTCFVPTTPNPTSGFIVLVPRRDVILLDMSVEQAMRLVISLGVLAPDEARRPRLEAAGPVSSKVP